MLRRLKLDIQGTVQGIGFRPFIYNLAHEKNLHGYVANTGSGVDIEVEGETEQLDIFIESIKSNTPALARITDIQAAGRLFRTGGEGEVRIMHPLTVKLLNGAEKRNRAAYE